MRASSALAVILLAAGGPHQEKEDEYSSREHGFRLRRPGPGWTLAPDANLPDVRFTFSVRRADPKDEVAVTVYVADLSGAADAKGVCDLAEARWKADPKVASVQRGSETLAGSDTPWLKFQWSAAGKTYTARLHYLVHHDSIYVLQSLAPSETFEANAKDFAAILATFEFIDLADPERHAKTLRLRRLASKCGSEIDWARDWKEASARAAREKKLVLVLVENYRGMGIQKYAPSTAFMDTDVVDLVRERFVAYPWQDRTGAPFESPEVYGLGPSTFGDGILFVTPEGRVVGEGVSFNPFQLYACARQILAVHPGVPAQDPNDVELLLRRGDLDQANELLKSPDSARGWRRRATLMMKLRCGDEALRAIARAGTESALEKGIVQLRLGRFAQAEKALSGLDTPEAKYWRAAARLMQVGLEPVRKELEKICEEHPESRWSWRAAALLQGLGLMSGLDRLEWPAEDVLAACSPSAPAAADAAAATQDAIAFLLKSQRSDGSWPSSLMLAEPVGGPPVAITSICGAALLPFRDRKEVATAIDRALVYAVYAAESGVLATDPRRTFDYTVWGQIFGLRFLARAMEFGEKKRILRAMNGLVGGLRDGRHRGGGWAYVRMGGEGSKEDNSIGFLTSAALGALREAKAAGAEAPDQMIAKAADAVAELCDPSGRAGYMHMTGREPAESEAEGSLRAPHYALALLRTGKGDLDGVRRGLEIYLKHRLHVRKERGKGLCHTGPEGTASYYLLFGYAFAAEATAELPREEQARFREALIDDVLHMRTADGGFCDNPMIGRAYGAGMALTALTRLTK